MQGEPRSGGWRATPSSAPSRLAKPGRIELQVLAVLRVLLNDVSSFQLWLCKLRIYNKHTRKPISQTYVGAFCDPHELVLHFDILYLSFCECFIVSLHHFTIRKAQLEVMVWFWYLVPAKVLFFLTFVEVRVFSKRLFHCKCPHTLAPGPRGWVNNCGVCISRGIHDWESFWYVMLWVDYG